MWCPACSSNQPCRCLWSWSWSSEQRDAGDFLALAEFGQVAFFRIFGDCRHEGWSYRRRKGDPGSWLKPPSQGLLPLSVASEAVSAHQQPRTSVSVLLLSVSRGLCPQNTAQPGLFRGMTGSCLDGYNSLHHSTYALSSWPPKGPLYNADLGTFEVVQWLRICLPMQGTQVPSLVWEYPTCRRATKPMGHNYWSQHA